MHKASLFLAAALILIATWFTATSTYGFDIAIYKDPLSWCNERYVWHHNEHPNQTYQDFLDSLGYDTTQMWSVYGWYRDMGVTKVMVNYPYADNFHDIPQDCTHIQVMNWFYPGLSKMYGEKYVDAQFRDVAVGDSTAFWSFGYSIPDPNWRVLHTENGGPVPNQRQVVTMSGSAGMLWRPQSYLGKFSGWDGLQTGMIDSSWFMPMHFKVTWAVDSDGPIDTTVALAYFYWMVHTPSSSMYGHTNVAWWRFPARPVILPTQGQANNWITTEFVDSANAGYYDLLDDNFNVLEDSIPWYDVRFGPAEFPNSLDDIYLGGVAYGAYTDVRMSVHYEGLHTFYLNRLEAYDEGAYRMFASPDSSHWADSIRVAFQNEYGSYAGGRSCGWYYDEWDESGLDNGNPVLRAIVKVNKILQDQNLPTFFMNGEYGSNTWDHAPRNNLFREEDAQGVNMSTEMNEFYFIGGGSCVPNANIYGGSPVQFMLTDSSSDGDYITASTCGNPIPDPNGQMQSQTRYAGEKSLQCAIDGYVWDYRYALNQIGAWVPWDDGTSPITNASLLFQTKYVHDYGEKHWALLQGGQDVPPDCTWNCCPIRIPTPNEVKLGAWLAVACDVDGIMWYPWDFGGLIEWDNGSFDTTARYAGAQKACNEIGRMMPILEPLNFVKTYASRAFERNYGDATNAATALDTLSTRNWCSYSYQAVQAVRAYEPCSPGDTACFMELPESYPYVQVSRFRNRHIPYDDPGVEDYWFLVVNRRALADEWRKVELEIPVIYQGPYYVRYVLADSSHLQPPSSERTEDCYYQTIATYLRPGEAELVHFTRGEFGCQDASAYVEGLTAIREGDDGIRLRWEEPTLSVDSLPFTPQVYDILQSCTGSDGQYDTIAHTETNTFLDSIVVAAEVRVFYMVHACGTVTPRPGGYQRIPPDKPKKEKAVSEIVPVYSR